VAARKDQESRKIVQKDEEIRCCGRSRGKTDGRTIEYEKTGMTSQSKIERERSGERK